MENNKFNKIFIVAFILMQSLFYAQCKKANLLIMIDENPSLTISDFYIGSSLEENIKVKYSVGSIDLNDDIYTKLMNNQSENINLSFEAILPNKPFASKYIVSVPKTFFNQDYIIVNIFNLYHKKYRKKYLKLVKNNKEYYVVLETPNSMKFD
ncbi:hypothetical protein N0B16_05625 [Chryseobacterium sp. GMJ5]|uniref:Uncharacterized protein n=1 Tax=Chryseobacterium gilvum TaxID=2976534 RepID=A0ABT2VZK8_9FLAO|nr:hypothetical protein [Chryseobacterium gilvum]MCU7613910.1 hypothetical protein [Chryseobacterium gilvum]